MLILALMALEAAEKSAENKRIESLLQKSVTFTTA
jgi:hypothetical protein